MRPRFYAALALGLFVSTPALAASVLVVAYDDSTANALSRALAHEGGDVAGSESSTLRGPALASALRELADVYGPDFMVMVAAASSPRKARVIVASAAGKIIAARSVSKKELASPRVARPLAAKVLASIAANEQKESYKDAAHPMVQVSSAYPAFAVPADAGYTRDH
jgi:hypothetical protein